MSWLSGLPEGSDDWDRLGKLLPEPLAALTDLHKSIWVSTNDPVLLELLRLRMAQLIRCEVALQELNPRAIEAGLTREKAGAVSDWPTSPHFSEKERRWLAFTEQWIGDVNGITDELFDPLLDYSSLEECNHIVFSMWPIEQALRMTVLLDLDRSPETYWVNPGLDESQRDGSRIHVNANRAKGRLRRDKHNDH